KAGVSMMVDLKVMAYFKISLSTRNWDRAALLPIFRRKTARRCGRRLNLTSQMAIDRINHCVPCPPSLWWQPN
ncbi:hypothetical protein K3H46_21195, partial [Aeromonas veronii]|uniref:hypothetical protein n=1 Tax=Aeromonas veronii TaxID=654 RepID=UPI001F2B4EFF